MLLMLAWIVSGRRVSGTKLLGSNRDFRYVPKSAGLTCLRRSTACAAECFEHLEIAPRNRSSRARFVRPGILSAERSRDLAQLEALRNAGDYDTSFALGVAELRGDLDRARAFVTDAMTVLAARGLIDVG